jgi:hypothetical protein
MQQHARAQQQQQECLVLTLPLPRQHLLLTQHQQLQHLQDAVPALLQQHLLLPKRQQLWLLLISRLAAMPAAVAAAAADASLRGCCLGSALLARSKTTTAQLRSVRCAEYHVARRNWVRSS